jgi:Arc/MetJ-type ribon-helix-helix transcriptional regulator
MRLQLDSTGHPPKNSTVTINLAKDVEDFVQEQLRRGVSPTASELINDVLRGVRDQQRTTFEVTPELEAWLLESADKPTSPLTGEDFDKIRERVLARTASKLPS